MDKTSILSTISSTPSNDKLLSEKAINDTLVKKTEIIDNLTSTDTDKPLSANQGKILNDKKIDKTSITTTIGYSSTDNQVPSAKSIYYNCIEGIEINQTTIDTYGTEILKYPLGIWRIVLGSIASKFTDLPVKSAGRIEITSINPNTKVNPWENQWSYRVYNFETINGGNYIRKLESSDKIGVISRDTDWKRVCTTSVADAHYFPKTIQFGCAATTEGNNKWVKIFEFTPNRYDWNGGNFIITFSSINIVNSNYLFGEYELIWKCNSLANGIDDVYLRKIISQNGDICHTNGSALCVGISENKKTVGLYAFLGVSSYQTMLATIISGGSRYENNQFEIGKWINIDTPTVGLEEQPTFSKANYYSLADNLGGWTYTATKLPVLNYTDVE